MMLFDEHDAARAVSEKLDSHEWWVFVGASGALPLIEEQFYSGDANADFEVMIGPPVGPFRDAFPGVRFLPLAFARKRRMSASQLARFVSAEGGARVTAAELERRDVIWIQEVTA
jgi:hypothetical protein